MTKQRTEPLNGLREKRIFRDVSQITIANLIGVTQSHYRQMEVGITRLDVHRAKKIADYFDCSIDELL